MNRTMLTATNTLSQLQHKLDMISNNMANADTNGYKRKEATFSDLLAQQFDNQQNTEKEAERLTPMGIRQGTGAKLGQAQLILTQGSFKTTDRDLDLALGDPSLYFTVSVKDNLGEQTRLTRDGAFYLSPESANSDRMKLVTAEGNSVLDQNGEPVVINGTVNSLTVSDKGRLTAHTETGEQTFELGVVSVKKPQFLDQFGGNLLGLPEDYTAMDINEEEIMTPLIGGLREGINVRQGALEASNVDMGKEMTDLMNVQRHYQLQSRSITLADQMMGLINGIR
ncbi:flagellar hook-basal body protein [Bacillus massiliglaciei]|uniref:flagellar hook-basal body protein n=1 Tax=Bacillus massiliglaciei TaxID=1816693 RepID=UPI000A7B5C73|nr:flagellar hook-basal body protein [Bacillus massiliglaciei]